MLTAPALDACIVTARTAGYAPRGVVGGAAGAVAEAAAAADDAARDAAWRAAAFAPDALGDRFQPVRELGRGGMGVVMLARDRSLHRTVALKLLHPGLAMSAAARARFRREARTQAQLAHPGIVAVHALGEERLADGRTLAWFAMPYVRGESLAARLRREGALPAAEVRRILGALCDALAHAHGEGVVHRDLKPENVLLEAGTGRVLLTDFGIAARPSHDDPRHGAADVGTPLYMAPEQFAGEHAIDGRTDLYALGAVGYLMLSGRAPFAGPSTRALAVARLVGPPPALVPLAPRAPAALVAAIERCLAPERGDRWPGAAAMHAALAAADAGASAVGVRLPRGWRAGMAAWWSRRLACPSPNATR